MTDEESESRFRSIALGYHGLGLCPIPLFPSSKRPAIPWAKIQSNGVSTEQLEEWENNNLWGGVALVCGKISHMVAFDCDSLALFEKLKGLIPPTWIVASGSGKRFHLYARITEGQVVETKHIETPWGHLDILGEGSVVVAPPSIHPVTGKPYAFVNKPDRIADYSEFSRLIEFLEPFVKSSRKPVVQLFSNPVTEGERNTSAIRIAGKLRSVGVNGEDMLAILKSWNKTWCSPPLPEEEIEAVAKCRVTAFMAA